jgi:molybdenum cofactor cytidylyltransferase
VTVPAVAVVPAAGRSERFGGMKLLADVRGEPLLNHTLRCLLDAGLDEIIVVTSPRSSLESASLLRNAHVRLAVNPDPDRGMFSSIQTGLEEADGDCIVILPADMPFVRSATVAQVLAESRSRSGLVVPVYRTRRGHPIAMPRRLGDELVHADSRKSLKEALLALNATPFELEVDDPGIVRDVDLREDLRTEN